MIDFRIRTMGALTAVIAMMSLAVPAEAAPGYTVSPTTLEFGDVAINTTSTAKTFTISNTGTVTLPIASIKVRGPHPGQFAQTNNCPANISVGSSCTVSVVFKPTWIGSTAAAAVWVVDGSGGTVKVQLLGTASSAPPPPAEAARVSISGGTRVNSIPQGNSGNSVLGQAGIGLAGGDIWVDGTLDNLSNVTLTLYDVGSESHWRNFIHLANTTGKKIRDRDDHANATTGVFTNGPPPFQLVGSVTQNSGLTNIEFSRLVDQDPEELQTVVNGQSPMMNVPGYGYASIALAYLDGSNQIVSGPTDRILVLLEDGGVDRDYDDYVGILEASPISTAVPEYTVSPMDLAFGDVAINTTSAAKTVTIRNTGTVTLPIASIKIRGPSPGQFAENNNCPANISVGSSCTVSVVFKPTGIGSKAAAVWVVDGSGDTVKVQLRGTGSS